MAYIPMNSVLYPLDSHNSKHVGRMVLLVDSSALREFILRVCDNIPTGEGSCSVTLWYDSNYFSIPPSLLESYMYSYSSMIGIPLIATSYSPTPPPGKSVIPSSLLESYLVVHMNDIMRHDVVVFCVAGECRMVPDSRKVVSESQVCQNAFISGKYDTVASRTNLIEKCAALQLSCVVVRAIRMDDPYAKVPYRWEVEPRVTCYYV